MRSVLCAKIETIPWRFFRLVFVVSAAIVGDRQDALARIYLQMVPEAGKGSGIGIGLLEGGDWWTITSSSTNKNEAVSTMIAPFDRLLLPIL